MEIGFDPSKSGRNARERRLSFDLVIELDWSRAVIVPDDRRDYGEVRMVATAPLGERLHVVCYTQRGDVRWVISFRKANRREVRAYGQAIDR